MKRPSRSLSLLSFPPRVAVWTAKPRARVLRKKLHVAEDFLPSLRSGAGPLSSKSPLKSHFIWHLARMLHHVLIACTGTD
ncbi:hypothetical protein Y1Q_0013830 [Alligator mississippiensis]|uniref:Uncharacterized protein n=1 Tax=Alligator mississippiensis TaxID=8496 RepID=A0A151NFN7_ALLMI|nr:hypothetical protein Y1Q_0013830 [Alligator mississippiensis]